MSELYAVVNDDPVPFHSNPVTICCEDSNTDAIYEDKQKAYEVRDRLREWHDNPDINVYKLTVDEVAR